MTVKLGHKKCVNFSRFEVLVRLTKERKKEIIFSKPRELTYFITTFLDSFPIAFLQEDEFQNLINMYFSKVLTVEEQNNICIQIYSWCQKTLPNEYPEKSNTEFYQQLEEYKSKPKLYDSLRTLFKELYS